ncbi:MAG: hypothetical protein ACOYB1_18430 [Limnohabitans sp.]
MKILVTRPPADKQGPDVVDALLVTDPAGIARGRREIDYHSTNRSQERGNCPLLPYMPTGSLINVTEAGGSYRGKLQSYSITIDISDDGREFTASTAIAIEREVTT